MTYYSLSGKALRDRLKVVIEKISSLILELKKKDGFIVAANFGCGSFRDSIEISRNLNQNCLIFNLDSDKKALDFGEGLLRKYHSSIQNINSIEGSFVNTHIYYVDVGWLIGVLCGMTHRQCVILLKILRKNFQKGGILMASSISPEMEKKDPTIFRLATKIGEWPLVPKNLSELQEIFWEAEYDPIEKISDRDGLHSIVIGKVR